MTTSNTKCHKSDKTLCEQMQKFEKKNRSSWKKEQ